MTAQEGSLVGQTLGVYRLRSLLGVGGMAEVYLAEDPALHRDVAVKVLPRTLASDPNYVERFRNEAQRVANLNHPNITPVYTFGDERGLFYLVMPRMKESLRERMEREGIISTQEAARLTNQIAAALYIAHQHGIVHRDVKPENILLDENGKAMLTDFGIARELATLREAGIARTLAATGLPVGTPEYMAPEQLRGQAATEQVDLYALGVVLYEMLTGRVPHDAATPYEVATAVLRDRPAPPSRFNETMTPELERVILTAMAKEPERRYPDMKAFALDLRAALNSTAQPINSGALRWTHYSPPDGAGASGPKLGPSLASATSSLILQPQIPINDTTKRPTVAYGGVALGGAALGGAALGGAALGSGRAKKARRQLSKGSVALFSIVSALALLALIVTGMKITDAIGLFSNSVGTPSLAAVHTATPGATNTPLPTATPKPQPTARTIYIQPTPPPPAPLSIAPTTVSITYTFNKYCTPSGNAPIIISNLDKSTVTWKWTTSKPSLTDSAINFRWSLNNPYNWQSGSLPSDSQGIAAYNGSTVHTDSLYLRVSCSGFKSAAPFTATMTDSLGRSYKITLTWAGG